jgi:hypothetical protein
MIRRTLAALAVIVVTTAPLAHPASAQLPPEVQQQLEIVSPLVAPQCGNAILVATILAGTVPEQAQEAIKLVTSDIYVACGSIPVTERAPTHCVDDDVMATVLAQLGGTLIGGALPVGTPGAGQVVDAIDVLREHLPIPADDESLVAMAAAALECRFATTAPHPPVYVPDDTEPGPGAEPEPAQAPVEAVLTPIGGSSVLTVAPTIPSAVAPQVLGPFAASPVDASRPRPVSYPIWIAILVLAVAALIVGRGLLASGT